MKKERKEEGGEEKKKSRRRGGRWKGAWEQKFQKNVRDAVHFFLFIVARAGS